MRTSYTSLIGLLSMALVVGVPSASGQLVDATIGLLDGTRHAGTISDIDKFGNVTLNEVPSELQLADILTIDMGSSASETPAEVTGSYLHLINGSRILISRPLIENETLSFESESRVSRVPLQFVRAIVWKSSVVTKEQIEHPSKSDDLVVVDTNEGERVVQGLVEGLDQQQVQIKYQNESRKISVNRINCVVMADLGLKLPDGPLATVSISDGSKVNGIIQFLQNGKLRLILSDSFEVELATDQIRSISIQSDRQKYLSDLEPINVRQKTEFILQRTWQRDRSILGDRLTLRVANLNQIQEFNKGLGTQAFTQLDFANESEFTRFKAIVGIDTETKGRGDCRMVVRGDGVELWSSRVKGTDMAREIDLDISGKKVISLIVYAGESFDLADHANWCNARFIR